MTKRETEKDARDLAHEIVDMFKNGPSHTEPDDEGRMIETVFVGTVMALTPSGKYYLPFACSNVEVCPRCKNPQGVTDDCRSCDFCGGLGSREAHLDEIWNEQLDRSIESYSHGTIWVESGEGCPTDILACRLVEETS
jgi:hypothetical protein